MSQIRVTITDERSGQESVSGGATTTTTNGAVTSNKVIKDTKVKENANNSQALAIASMVASQSFSYMTSNVGKWTGSTQKQTAVNNAMQLVSIGAMAYINPALAVVNVGLNLATTAIDTAYEQKWDRYSKDYARKRAGELKGRGR